MENTGFGLTGISLNQVQKAIENNPIEEPIEVVVQEPEQVNASEPEITEEMILKTDKEGRCYLRIDTNPVDAVILVKNNSTKEVLEKNPFSVYDVGAGSYSIDITADGYENISTSALVTAFDTELGYMHISIDLNKIEQPVIVETDNVVGEFVEEDNFVNPIDDGHSEEILEINYDIVNNSDTKEEQTIED